MKYLIWTKGTLEQNLEAFSKINNLRSLPLTPLLEKYALRFLLNYPNNTNTSQYAEPLICKNPNSPYFNAVAIPIFDAMYEGLSEAIVKDLISLGVRLPDEGIAQAISELPADWNIPIVT